MSVHAARALIGWRTTGGCHIYCVSLWNGVSSMRLLCCVLKSMYQGEDGSYLSSGYTMVLPLQSAVEATVDHCKTVCFRQLFGDVNLVSLVLSQKLLKCFKIVIFMKFA